MKHHLTFAVGFATLGLFACSDGTSTTSTASAGGATDGATSSSTSGATSGNGGSGGMGGDFVVGGARPVKVHVPPSYDGKTPAPLLILLHGYGVTSAIQEAYMNFTPVTDANGMLYAHPDGTPDATNKQFWTATDACCNFAGAPVDDSAYLKGIIDEIEQKAAIDRKRVYFVGHSNGGFMSYRMACDHADDIAAIASLAGATFSDITKCKPTSPVAVLEMHGTGDMTVVYGGGTFANAYPSATTTVSTWAGYDGCATTPDTSGAPHDIDSTIQGASGPAEATVTTYATGCKPGGYAELWTIPGGVHIPTLAPTFAEQVVTFLLAHPKP